MSPGCQGLCVLHAQDDFCLSGPSLSLVYCTSSVLGLPPQGCVQIGSCAFVKMKILPPCLPLSTSFSWSFTQFESMLQIFREHSPQMLVSFSAPRCASVLDVNVHQTCVRWVWPDGHCSSSFSIHGIFSSPLQAWVSGPYLRLVPRWHPLLKPPVLLNQGPHLPVLSDLSLSNSPSTCMRLNKTSEKLAPWASLRPTAARPCHRHFWNPARTLGGHDSHNHAQTLGYSLSRPLLPLLLPPSPAQS